ncbi:MAG: ATP-binding cassette domain-containing protein [Xanthomonadales bacterium]|nr:ATP-binding cassette domain-containing protein [Xanthomonadales bacterium]
MSKAFLSVSNINKSFSNVKAVVDLSFEVHPGTIYALLGPNGAGKTTTVRMLLDIIRPDSGVIAYNNNSNGRINPAKMGYLPEERGMYPDKSPLDSLVYLAMLRGMKRNDAKQEASKWLKRFDLADRENDKLQTLSKGNQQKVQLISSILHRPDFAILDEPFSGFDPVNQEKVIKIIHELSADGMTIVLSAHQMDLVERLADEILLLSHGTAVLQGKMKDVLKEASSALKLSIDVAAINQQTLAGLSDICNYEIADVDGNKRITFFLHDENNVGQLLKACTETMSIHNINTETIGLHRIYLDAVKKHKESINV